MYNPVSAGLSIELLKPKDNYETPAHVWRYATRAYALDYDVHTSSLNAVLPSYGTRDDHEIPTGLSCWLNAPPMAPTAALSQMLWPLARRRVPCGCRKQNPT